MTVSTRQRRQFLKELGGAAGAGSLLSLTGAAPQLLRQAAAAADPGADRVLVVLQLSGGNDGLNTVVPFRDDEYYKRRPTLAVSESQVLRCNDDTGLHPSLAELHGIFQDQQLAIMQGVGYDNPNRSHFESMDIWHTCRRKGEPRDTGWLGRCFDQWGAIRGDVPGMHLGDKKQPLALLASKNSVPSIASVEKFRLENEKGQFKQVVQGAAKTSESDPLLSFVQSSTTSALDMSQRVREATKNNKSQVRYPETPLGEQFRAIAQLIQAGLGTRIYYLEFDGFDTHAQQEGAHAGLLRKWGDAVAAFHKDITAQGNEKRVLTFCFSEFGRRVAENASKGTDHGAGAPVFLVGAPVKGGVHGKQPSLTDLLQGDLKHHTDFRRVYATLLEKWLGVPSEPMLLGKHEPLDVLS